MTGTPPLLTQVATPAKQGGASGRIGCLLNMMKIFPWLYMVIVTHLRTDMNETGKICRMEK